MQLVHAKPMLNYRKRKLATRPNWQEQKKKDEIYTGLQGQLWQEDTPRSCWRKPVGTNPKEKPERKVRYNMERVILEMARKRRQEMKIRTRRIKRYALSCLYQEPEGGPWPV